MPRHPALRGTSVFPKDLKSNLPFIDEFCDNLRPAKESISTKTLHTIYCNFVEVSTNDSLQRKCASSLRRFSIQFCQIARTRMFKVNSHGRRGYFIQCTRRIRCSNQNVHNTSMEEDKNNPVKVVFISRQKGYGAFAERDISVGEYVCDYEGEIIPESVVDSREEEYRRRNLPETMINIGNKQFLDGNRNSDGRLTTVRENIGTALNHSFLNPNCCLKKVTDEREPRFCIYAITGIAKNAELSWNYNYKDKDTPDWFHKS